MKPFWGIIKKILPWLAAILIFVFLFREYKPSQVWKAVEHVRLGYFLGLGIAYFIVLYVVDSLTMSWAFTRFEHKVGFRDVLPARGVTYLIMNLNYPAAQAAFAYYMKRVHNIPIFEALGIFFYIAIIDLYILITLIFISSFFQHSIVRGVDIGTYMRVLVLCAYALAASFIVFKRWIPKMKWIFSRKIFCIFDQAKVVDYLKIAVMRSPIHATIILFMFVAVKAFDAYVPFVKVLGTTPIAFLIGTLPITPGGLGTTNAAVVELLSPFLSAPTVANGVVTASELLFAVTVLWMVVNYSLKFLCGLVWLWKVGGRLFKPTEDANNKEVVSEATHLMGDI